MGFLRPQHPKTSIKPTREAIAKAILLGWVGQVKVIEEESNEIEGLVFRNPNTPGFNDTSIIRCRREGINFGIKRALEKYKRKSVI